MIQSFQRKLKIHKNVRLALKLRFPNFMTTNSESTQQYDHFYIGHAFEISCLLAVQANLYLFYNIYMSKVTKEQIDALFEQAFQLENERKIQEAVKIYRKALSDLNELINQTQNNQPLIDLYNEVNVHNLQLMELAQGNPPQIQTQHPRSISQPPVPKPEKQSSNNQSQSRTPQPLNQEETDQKWKQMTQEVGSGILKAGLSTFAALTAFNNKYQVGARLKQATVTGFEQLKTMNQKYKITDKIQSGITQAGDFVGTTLSKTVPLDSNPQQTQYDQKQ
ncbi:MAG: hypothetical protein EZS28_009043 [Streblomastix strix]|uniref:MIT domain-containing protein n=1 Tax=Streblomastix strix TaxID=222440 RepID=A0A5J4WKA4_9EUKA|nr:MAG: hypothetical protein EZS28_009043 [Streblomastix strix]